VRAAAFQPVLPSNSICMYKLTATSLYAAVTTGKTTDSIVAQLQRMCKNRLQSATIEFIHHHTRDIGKLQLVEADSGMTVAVYDEAIARKMMGGELGCRLQQLGLHAAGGAEQGHAARDVDWQREFDDNRVVPSDSATFHFDVTVPANVTRILKTLLECALAPSPPLQHRTQNPPLPLPPSGSTTASSAFTISSVTPLPGSSPCRSKTVLLSGLIKTSVCRGSSAAVARAQASLCFPAVRARRLWVSALPHAFKGIRWYCVPT